MNLNLDKINLGKLLPDENLPPEVAASEVSAIDLDSRAVKPGGLFIAIKGAVTDGRNYISQAIGNGAVAVLAESEKFSIDYIDGIPVVSLVRLSERVGPIAARFYRHPSGKLKVIGVTGTNGKSTCVSLVAQLISLLGKKAGIIGTLGYGIVGESTFDTGMTTPDAVSNQRILHELLQQRATVVAMEVSSHGISQYRVEGIEFLAAAFTNLTRDHLDYHESFEEYGAAKASLFSRPELAFCVVNLDDNFGRAIAETNVSPGVRAYTVSLSNAAADVYARHFDLSSEGIVAEIVTPWGEARINSTLAGEFNLANVLTALTCVCGAGFEFADVREAIPKMNAVAGRMQRVIMDESASMNLNVFVDYAHTPDALERALSALKKSTPNRLWVVFGCGGDRDKGKRSVMGAIAEKLADKVVITSDNPRSEDPVAIIADIETGFGTRNFVSIVNRQEAIEYAIGEANTDDCILIAGKGHENYQILGDEKIFFDDYLVAKTALQKKFNVLGAVQ